MSERFIRYLVENRYDVQDLRKPAFNRIVAYVKTNSHRYKEFMDIKCRECGFVIKEFEDLPSSAKWYLKFFRRVDGKCPKCSHVLPRKIEQKPYASVAKQITTGKISVSDQDEALRIMVWYFNVLMETEKELGKRIDRWSETFPIRTLYLDKIYGIGPIFAGGIIAWLRLIILSEKCDTVSKCWAYCGRSAIHWESECAGHVDKKGRKVVHKMITTSAPSMCPVKVKKKGGKKEERAPCGAEIVKSLLVHSPPRRKAGYVLMINARLQSFTWVIATSFEKQQAKKSQYRRDYVKVKAKYANRPDLKAEVDKGTPGAEGHIRSMALNYTVKRFIADLWYFWRKMEGLPVTMPYVVAQLGHRFEEPRTDEEINQSPMEESVEEEDFWEESEEEPGGRRDQRGT